MSNDTEKKSSALSEAAAFVEAIDPLSGPNLMRRAAERLIDNGDGTMTFRKPAPYYMKEVEAANPMIAGAIERGEETTGLCTVRDAVAAMMDQKGDRMEMCLVIDGKRINVELHITRVEDALACQ